MKLLGTTAIIKQIGELADDLFTSDEERLKIANEDKKIKADLIQAQTKINMTEAQHQSVFVAGWRPFIGWVGGIALAYQFIFYPMMVWGWALGQAQGWIPCHIDMQITADVCTYTTPPVFDRGPLFAIITGMLGIGGLRSLDKRNKVETKKIH
ncbi:3TM-type holin [Zooshikella ganghwensis]|uniref:3TM-type holin n=1 Tax=Zooshikella ganghwensis TaxID=202772 RepID=UPI000417AC59|nr:3TM-type holin [Zooshikella ganghwensis]